MPLKYTQNNYSRKILHRSKTTNKVTLSSNMINDFLLNKRIHHQNIYDISNPLKPSSSTKNTNKSLEKMFKYPQIYTKNILKFNKIIKPKLPFSKRSIEDNETKKIRLIHKKPSRLFQDCNTINWFRKKYSDSMIEKSILSLLPDAGKPVIPENESEEDKRHREVIMYLNSLKGPKGREKNINIHPKYFFNTKTFQTILKLKKIFLEFDEDGNRRMEIDEMYKMFNENHINVNFDELVDLFFTGKKFKKEDIMKLYLDFYQFLKFALNKDAEYRQFMRKIKKKSDKNEYLPMNFNSTLDYFIFKGKERSSQEIIKKAMDEMDKIINIDKKEINEKIEKKLSFKGDKRKKTAKKNDKFISSKNSSPTKVKRRDSNFLNSEKINKDTKSKRKSIKKDNFNIEDLVKDIVTYNFDYDDQLKKINFDQLINEFSNLFNLDNDKFGTDDNNEDDSYFDIIKDKKINFGLNKRLKDVIFPNTKTSSVNKKSLSMSNNGENTNDKTIKLKKSNSNINKNIRKIKLLYLNNKKQKAPDSVPSSFINNNIFNVNNKETFVTADGGITNSSNKKIDYDYVPLKFLVPPKTHFSKYISNYIQKNSNINIE